MPDIYTPKLHQELRMSFQALGKTHSDTAKALNETAEFRLAAVYLQLEVDDSIKRNRYVVFNGGS